MKNLIAVVTVLMAIAMGTLAEQPTVPTQLTLSLSPSSPEKGLLPANTDGQTVAVITITANREVTISHLPMYIGQLGDGHLKLERVAVYNGATLIGQTLDTPMDQEIQVQLTPPLVVTGSTTLTIKVNTGTVAENESGQGFFVQVPSYKTVTTEKEVSVSSEPLNSAHFYVMRSVPTVLLNEQLEHGVESSGLSKEPLNDEKLYVFGVAASSSADIGIGKLTFTIKTQNVELTNPKLDLGSDDFLPLTMANKESGTYVAEFKEPWMVPGGTIKYIGLNANLRPINDEASVTVQLLGDETFGVGAIPTQYKNTASKRFVWTDFSATPLLEAADKTVWTAEQWFGGMLVPTIDGSKLPRESMAVAFSR